jgi:hypothetical protein
MYASPRWRRKISEHPVQLMIAPYEDLDEIIVIEHLTKLLMVDPPVAHPAALLYGASGTLPGQFLFRFVRWTLAPFPHCSPTSILRATRLRRGFNSG